MTLEELLQAAVDARATTDEAQWQLGTICMALVERDIKRGEIASLLGCSTQRVTALIRTWDTFPKEEDRVPELTWKHHEIASRADSPDEFLWAAADHQWSIKEMSAALKTPKPEEEAAFERATRALNLVNRVLEGNDAAAEWLSEQIRNVLFR